MKKPRKFAVAVIGLAAGLAAVPFLALAQTQNPPAPPTTYYGTVTGGTPGQTVTAFIQTAAGVTNCGTGQVMNDAQYGIVYVVDVEQQASRAGCGAAGRQIRFYFSPASSAGGGRFAAQSANWASAGAQERNLTLNPPMANRLIAPQVVSRVSR